MVLSVSGSLPVHYYFSAIDDVDTLWQADKAVGMSADELSVQAVDIEEGIDGLGLGSLYTCGITEENIDFRTTADIGSDKCPESL